MRRNIFMFKIPKEVEELNEIFKSHEKKLYIVGGYVRDQFLEVKSFIRDDIDLCSNVKPKELKKMLEGTKFSLSALNEKLGVMIILGTKRYEYACFRKETYDDNSHIPNKVEFVSSLETDAIRRDFKINAIYYDIEEKEFIDPLGGINDLKMRQISTVMDPKIVFNDDPERILRLIRFACTLGLNIPDEEMRYAKKNAPKIAFISKSRLKKEFEKLLTADQFYPELYYTKEAHFRAMVLLGEIDAWKIIMPAMHDLQTTSFVDSKGEPIYEHTLNCLKTASPKIRLAILLHDCAKVKTMERKNNFFGAREFVSTIVEANLGIDGLGFSNELVKKTIKIILGYDFNHFGLASEKTVRKFIFENHDVIENIIEIKDVIKNENRETPRFARSSMILRNIYNKMLKLGSPFNLADLKINGNDVIKNFPDIRVENIDTLLDNLLFEAALNPKKNNKESLIVLARKMINSKRDFYLDE